VIEQHRLAAQARNVRAELRLAPMTLNADADKLRVVVDNLVSNAIKYSPDGGTIALSMVQRGDTVMLDVSDAGPGIPVEDREQIFEWFYRGEHGHQGRVRGSGLGLAIARELVAAHKGTIEVVDVAAGGARFRVTLPINGEAGA
jgi:two-component system, NtrC family, sensor histidine kinase GlrK